MDTSLFFTPSTCIFTQGYKRLVWELKNEISNRLRDDNIFNRSPC
jgi:hypothetical protein